MRRIVSQTAQDQQTQPATQAPPTQATPTQSTVSRRTLGGNATQLPPVSAGPRTDSGWIKSSSQARQITQEERKRRQEFKAGNKPFRFNVPLNQQKEYVILDANFEEQPRSFWEHRIRGAENKWKDYEGCPGEFAYCPLCPRPKSECQRYFVHMFTVIDMTPYTIKTGDRAGQTIEFSKKLLPIKDTQIEQMYRLQQNHGTLRGLHILAARESNTTPGNGTLEFVEKISEEELINEFGHPAKVENGEVLQEENWMITPFNIVQLFPEPNSDELCRKYGGRRPEGNYQNAAADFNEHPNQVEQSDDAELPF